MRAGPPPTGPEVEGLLGQGQQGAGGFAGKVSSMKKGINVVNTLWFVAGCCVCFGGIFGACDLLFTSISPIEFLQEVYLIFFGGIMFLLDAPLAFAVISRIRQNIRKYASFITRLVGRGIFYMFLGCMTFASLWDAEISYFLAIVLGLFVVVVGAVSLALGIRMTQRLQTVKVAARERQQEIQALIQQHGVQKRGAGLAKPEFNNFVQALRPGIPPFNNEELDHVFNALCESDIETVTKEDLSMWMTEEFWLLV